MPENEIVTHLFELQDPGYRDFQSRLIPTIDSKLVIGVRTPQLRAYTRNLIREGKAEEFLHALPHRYFEENQLHSFLISEIRDYDRCVEEVCRFLPYIDNWATCDQLSPKVFQKHHGELLPEIKEWIRSDQTYTIRFGIGMLMRYFLDEDYDAAYPEMVAGVCSEEYYVNMMMAWYFATALAKQYEDILPYLENRRLSLWVHNKTIQKAVESFRLTADQKSFLRTLRRDYSCTG